jgi:hypothetical protein
MPAESGIGMICSARLRQKEETVVVIALKPRRDVTFDIVISTSRGSKLYQALRRPKL